MSRYTLLYLPVDKPLVDGCKAINVFGDIVEYSELTWYPGELKAAAPFLTDRIFNEQIVVGRPSIKTLKWLKHGMSVRSVDCILLPLSALDIILGTPCYNVKCPTCQTLH